MTPLAILASVAVGWWSLTTAGPVVIGLVIYAVRRDRRYLMNNLIALDQQINTVCGGDPDETISSRLGKRRDGNERWWSRVVNFLFFWQRDHTTASIEQDEGNDSIL